MNFFVLLALHGVSAWYRVNFYHGSRTCASGSLAFSTFGADVEKDFLRAEKCRYYETYKLDGTMLYHLAFKVVRNSTGYSLTDYKPSIGIEGCVSPPQKPDPAFAFTLDFNATKQCIGADSPDGDPSGESWMIEWSLGTAPIIA